MTINVNWIDDKNHTLMINFQDSWTLSDLYTAFDTAHHMMYDAEYPVIVIVNTLSSSPQFFKGDVAAQFCAIARRMHLNTGHIIVVAQDTVPRGLFYLLQRVNMRFKQLSSLVNDMNHAHTLAHSLGDRSVHTRTLAS